MYLYPDAHSAYLITPILVVNQIAVGEVNLLGVAHAERAAEALLKLAVVYSYVGALLGVGGYSLAGGGIGGNGGILAVVECELNVFTAGRETFVVEGYAVGLLHTCGKAAVIGGAV